MFQNAKDRSPDSEPETSRRVCSRDQHDAYCADSYKGRWLSLADKWIRDHAPCPLVDYYTSVTAIMPIHILSRCKKKRVERYALAKRALNCLKRPNIKYRVQIDVIDDMIVIVRKQFLKKSSADRKCFREKKYLTSPILDFSVATPKKLSVRVHPAADMFPMMDNESFERLKWDIETNGLNSPIKYWHDGSLLDGRSRLLACQELGIQPDAIQYDGHTSIDPFTYVISSNLHRRQLTTAQRSMVAARMATLKRGRPEKENGQICPFTEKTLSDAASKLRVSRRSVVTAKHVIANGSQPVVDAVDNGSVSISLASKLVTEVPDKKIQSELVGKGSKAIRDYITPSDAVRDAAAAECDHTENNFLGEFKGLWERADEIGRLLIREYFQEIT